MCYYKQLWCKQATVVEMHNLYKRVFPFPWFGLWFTMHFVPLFLNLVENKHKTPLVIKVYDQGRIQDFHWGGGGAQKRCACRSRARSPRSLTAGVQGACLRALEALRGGGGGLMPSCANWAFIFKHSDTKWDLKEIVNQIEGGVPVVPSPPPPPLNPPLMINNTLLPLTSLHFHNL